MEELFFELKQKVYEKLDINLSAGKIVTVPD